MLTFAIICLATAVAVAGVAWFLSRQGLERADQWASVLAFLFALPVGVFGFLFAILAWRDGRNTHVTPKRGESRAGTTFNVQAGRDAYTAETMKFDQRSQTSHGDDLER